jgi:hypothetical protein
VLQGGQAFTYLKQFQLPPMIKYSILQRLDKIQARVFKEQGKEASLRVPDKGREREIPRLAAQGC